MIPGGRRYSDGPVDLREVAIAAVAAALCVYGFGLWPPRLRAALDWHFSGRAGRRYTD